MRDISENSLETPLDRKRVFLACRVDPMLAGDKSAVESALAATGYDNTIEGAKRFLHDWCDIMKPEYITFFCIFD